VNTIKKLMLGAAVVAAAVAVPVAGQANAAPKAGVGIQSVPSVPAHVNRDPVWILQCPVAGCNHGTVGPSSPLRAYCWVSGGSGPDHGPFWDLVIDSSNNVSGFIPEAYLDISLPYDKQC
jgi:hypothetical protein